MIGVISAGIGAIGSIAQGLMGASQVKRAKRAISQYRRQDLQNIADGISISTQGAEMAAEQLSVNTASAIQALQQGGVRGVVGGVGKVMDSANNKLTQITADIDKQVVEKEKIRAQDEARIRDMQERREEQDLAGLGQELAVGQQNIFGGIAGLGQSMGQFAGMSLGSANATPASSLSSQGGSILSASSAPSAPTSLPRLSYNI